MAACGRPVNCNTIPDSHATWALASRYYGPRTPWGVLIAGGLCAVACMLTNNSEGWEGGFILSKFGESEQNAKALYLSPTAYTAHILNTFQRCAGRSKPRIHHHRNLKRKTAAQGHDPARQSNLNGLLGLYYFAPISNSGKTAICIGNA